ncbi:GDSL esterase/lipase At4g10955-like [Typha angustifolia]|uniref:GDSL esterase/lipase At4g10955-like n=1 Tax=Typha angustifolia TaxID=59011 RepID=UPI003C2E29FC
MEGHPHDFKAYGPRDLALPNWRDLISSSWSDPNYKRMVMACFIQVAYLLELDRQAKRTGNDSIAPRWWKPFKYKLAEILIDERDGSIYGAILEWDRSAALSNFVVMRPCGAPKAVLALRGTILRRPTFRRDIEDDLRILAYESLKTSVRFHGALQALKTMVAKCGKDNVSIAGHSLGAAFALQVGKALAGEGIYVDCHVFNPPSVSLARTVKTIRETAGSAFRRFTTSNGNPKRWVPNLYVNERDYLSCHYTRTGVVTDPTPAKAKLFKVGKGPTRILEAHQLQQWWSNDVELQLALQDSDLINKQLRSLYAKGS